MRQLYCSSSDVVGLNRSSLAAPSDDFGHLGILAPPVADSPVDYSEPRKVSYAGQTNFVPPSKRLSRAGEITSR